MESPNRKKWLVSQLRRLSMKWPPRNRVLKASRRELPRKIKKDGTPYKKANYEYRCNGCKNWFPNSKITMDHIKPVVDPKDVSIKTEEEFVGKFAVSLLSYENNWQVLCKNCHDSKSQKENKIRKKVKNRKKS